MIWQSDRRRNFLFFSVSFFLSYSVIFLSLYAVFPTVRDHFLLPLLRTEVALLDPSSDLRSLKAAPTPVMGAIHFEIVLPRHPEGSLSRQPGLLVLRAHFTFKDSMIQACLMLALALAWRGVPLFRRFQAVCAVLLSWLCFFSLLFPFALLNDGLPPIGPRLSFIHWWNIFLTHKGNAVLTLLFFLGNMYLLYLFAKKTQAGATADRPQLSTTTSSTTSQ